MTPAPTEIKDPVITSLTLAVYKAVVDISGPVDLYTDEYGDDGLSEGIILCRAILSAAVASGVLFGLRLADDNPDLVDWAGKVLQRSVARATTIEDNDNYHRLMDAITVQLNDSMKAESVPGPYA